MRIGLVSDTHDNLPRIRQAVAVFDAAACDLVLHAGDHVAPFTLDAWGGLKAPFEGVFGNNDGERKGLMEKSRGRIRGEVLEKEVGGRRILVVHDPVLAEGILARGGRYDVVVFGHTHERHREERDGTLWVNPGEAGGWVTGQSSVAILDTETLGVEFVDLGLTER